MLLDSSLQFSTIKSEGIQESVAHSEEINKSTNCHWKRTDGSLLDKDFKTAIFKMLRKLKDNVEKLKKTMCEQNETITKEGKPKRNQKETLELKSAITCTVKWKTH